MNVDALGDSQAARARHQRHRLFDHDVVLVVTALVTDLEHVPEALGRDQGGACSLTLEDCVGRQRSAMN